MEKIIASVKKFVKDFISSYSTPEEIKNPADYLRIKKWSKNVKKLYKIFFIIGIVTSVITLLIILAIPSVMKEIPLLIRPFVIILTPFLKLLTYLGYATLIIYIPKIFKSVMKSSKVGYDVGEKIETTHVDVTHEYGNTYKVSSHTENKGCLFAVIGGGVHFLAWTFFCVYIGPFVTYKKIKATDENLKKYEETADVAKTVEAN